MMSDKPFQTEEQLIVAAEALAAHWAQRDEIEWFDLSRDVLKLLRDQKDVYEAKLATLRETIQLHDGEEGG